MRPRGPRASFSARRSNVIETVLASPREAALLECTTALPMMLLHRRTVDAEGVPIEHVRALYRGDRMAFETRLCE